MTLSSTVFQGNRAPFWKTTIRSEPGLSSRPGAAMRAPSRRISPAVRSSKPAMVLRSVVLPQPEGPTTTQIPPGGTWKEQSSTATTCAPSGS